MIITPEREISEGNDEVGADDGLGGLLQHGEDELQVLLTEL
jgi:hypothetical protein